MAEQIIFGIAAACALASGIAVVTLENAFRATVALIVTLLSVAVIFLLLAAPFVAVIQVIVYAGAIVVLFLFVIAYLGDRPPPGIPDRLAPYQAIGWLMVIALVAQGGIVLANSNLPGLRDEPRDVGDIGSPEAIGRAFIDDHIVPFEATSAILLVAAVAAVLLAKRAVKFEGGR
jgi:NADH-quinone oxidoreductase subunit J